MLYLVILPLGWHGALGVSIKRRGTYKIDPTGQNRSGKPFNVFLVENVIGYYQAKYKVANE